MAKKTILLVDPCSSRLNFIDEILKAGYNPVCIFPFHAFDESYESMCYRNELSTIKSICREKTTVIDAPENIDELIPQLSEFEIIGVINCSDFATHISDVIGEKVGCPINPSSNSDIRMDKYKMQMAVKEYGLRHIKTGIVKNEEDVKKFWEENKIVKGIIKPCISTGMKGVHYCDDPSDAFVALYSQMNDTNDAGKKHQNIILQEYIKGSHYFFNTVSIKGTHRIMQAWLVRDGFNEQGLFTISYTSFPVYPSGMRGVVRYLFNVLDALDFKNGVAQTEIMVDEKGPVLMEVNPRMMKFYVEPEIQDKAFGNHNSDVAIMAMTEPEEFLNTWVGTGTVKPILIRHLVSNVEGPRYAKPAETLLSLIKSVIDVRLSVPTDCMVDMKRTTYRAFNPGVVQLFDDDMTTHFNALTNIEIIEKRYPNLLWDTVEKHESCGFKSDVNDIASEIKGKTVAVLNDIGVIEWKDGKYGTIDDSKKYGYGVIVLGGEYKLDERYLQIKKFCEIIKEGGMIYALQSSYQNMPYGETGMEATLNLLGCSIDYPESARDLVIRCIVHH